MQEIPFVKMQSLGNDFVLLDGTRRSISFDPASIRRLADRHCGIGFDQLLYIEKSTIADAKCLIFNADGSEAEQCGNGMRCVARYLHEFTICSKKTLSIETKAGLIHATIHSFQEIEVNMGTPCFLPEKIPFLIDAFQACYSVTVEGNRNIELCVVSMGNPHAIMRVDHVADYPIESVGSSLNHHPLFPKGVNFGIVEVIDKNHLKLRTFERGARETYACGSNACAAIVAGVLNHWIESPIKIKLALGELTLAWEGEKHPVIMTGPAELVFSGMVRL